MSVFGADGRTLRALAFASACAAGIVPAAAEQIDAHYSVTLMGLRIGDLYAQGSLQPQSYRMDVNAHLTGIAAMVSNLRLALASTGTVSKRGTLAPSTYATSAVGSEETHTLRMALNGGNVRAVEISRPRNSAASASRSRTPTSATCSIRRAP